MIRKINNVIFSMAQGHGNWTVFDVNIKDDVKEIIFPEETGRINISKTRCFPNVRKLHIPKATYAIDICNVSFPNLEEIVIEEGNQHFQFQKEGKSLILDNDKLLNVFERSQKTYTLESKITSIYDYAFEGTLFTNIIGGRASHCTIKAFENSAILEKGRQQGYLLVGCCIFDLREDSSKPVEYMKIPSYLNIWNINCGNFGAMKCKTIEIETVDSLDCISLAREGKIIHTGKLTKSEIYKLNAVKSSEIEVRDPEFCVNDNVVYTKNGRVLVHCPSMIDKQKLVIPEGVQRIHNRAFYRNKTIKEITLPDSLCVIGINAFSDSNIEKVTFGKGLIQLGMGINSNVNIFSDTKIKDLVIPGNLKYIGNGVFRNSVLQTVTLEEGVEIIGSDALKPFKSDTKKEICLPSSIRILQKNSLSGYDTVHVQNHHIANLISALDDTKNVMLTCGECEYFIPQGINQGYLEQLDNAWICGATAFEEAYRKILNHFGGTFLNLFRFMLWNYEKDKVQYADNMSWFREQDSKGNVYTICNSLLSKNEEEKTIISILKAGILRKEELQKLLSEKKLSLTVSSYILQAIQQFDKPESQFML